MRRLLAPLVLLGLSACPGLPLPDGGVSDGGEPAADSGQADAGSADAGLPDAGYREVPAGDYCAARVLAECARDVRCLRLEEHRLADCVQRRGHSCNQPELSASVAQGRLQYFAAAGAACLNAFGHGACVDEPTECAGLFQGLVPPDGGCALEQECQQGSYCLVNTTSCPFKCYAYAKLGQLCNYWDQQCDRKEALCGLDGGVAVCNPLPGVGETCAFNCREGLGCISGKCYPYQAKLGETCNQSQGFPYCDSQTFCRTEGRQSDGGFPPGTCQKKIDLGGVCANYGACQPYLRCSSSYVTGTCILLGAEGEPCTGNEDCKDELFCSGKISRCTAFPPDGGDCTAQGTGYECAPNYYCDYYVQGQPYTCTPLKAQGQECAYAGACLSDTCEYGPIADGGVGYRCSQPCSRRVDGGF